VEKSLLDWLKPVLSEVEGLALFGFVFPWPENGKFLIFFLYQRAYVNLNLQKLALFCIKIG